jgi:NAD(P)-dependent dehydrogenase (short-subunit alcohol dehydrogenase family)
VYLAARSESRAQEAIEKLYSEIPTLERGKLVWLPLDLADLDSVAKAAETIRENEARLDILSMFASTPKVRSLRC